MATAVNIDYLCLITKFKSIAEKQPPPTPPFSLHPHVCKAVDGEISGASATYGTSHQMNQEGVVVVSKRLDHISDYSLMT